MRATRSAVTLGSLLLGAVVLVSCAQSPPPPPPPPPPDPDATPAQAGVLNLGTLHADTLDRSANDRDDWYRIDLPGPGTLRLKLSAASAAGLPGIFIALASPTGVPEAQPVRAGGRTEVELSKEVQKAGTVLVWVGTEPDATAAVPYDLRADFQARRIPEPPVPCAPGTHRVHGRCVEVQQAPPPCPAGTHRVQGECVENVHLETIRTTVIEVARDHGEIDSATIAAGQKMGVKPGLHGRFVDNGTTIGTFEVIEVYPAGSRVHIQGRLSGTISGHTEVQVDVPSGRSP